MSFDFSFSNPLIHGYFFGKEPAPISAFIYVHSHPLIRPNFVKQLEQVFDAVNKYFQNRKPSQNIVEKFQKKTLRLAQLMPLTEESAEESLEVLKSLVNLTQKLNPSLLDSLR